MKCLNIKRILVFNAVTLLCVGMSYAQTFAIYSKGNAILATPDEVGEMMVSGSKISIGNMELELTEIDSMTYSAQNFDPQMMKVEFNGENCNTKTPLAIMPYLSMEKNGAYITVRSTAVREPEIIYSLSGSTSNGGFTLEGEFKCGVQLNGVSITSNQGAAVHIKNGKRIDIEAVAGTQNNFVDYAQGVQDACFHVKGHPEFKGSGTINITGNAKHAYKSGEYTLLKKSVGKINILSAVSDGMHIGQYFQMKGGEINIPNTVRGDGIQVDSTNDATDEFNGQILLDSGVIKINISGDDCDGMKCDSAFTATGGNVTITTSGKDSKCINVGTAAYIRATTGSPKFTLTSTGGYLLVGTDKKKSACFKTNNDFYFYGGSITATATGDKGRSVKVGGDYHYVPSAISLIAQPAIDVDGNMYVEAQP